jgi:proteasome lid subunit RPN8/RPN11
MIRIHPEAMRAIRTHGEETYPEECCGAVLGVVAGEVREVRTACRIDNARPDERERRFVIRPEDYRRMELEADRLGLVLVGFYHSHPDHPARPSEYDRAHALPWHSYLVLAVAGGRGEECTSWVLSEDRSAFLPEPLVESGGEEAAR